MAKNKLVCFDVDGTLVEEKSSWLTITEGLGFSVEEVISIYGAAMNEKISFAEGEKRVADIYRSGGKATKENIWEIFSRVPLRAQAMETIGYLKGKGYDIWLISGAVDVYVESVAKKIGAAGFYAHASLEFNYQGVLSKIHYSSNQNPWKAEIIQKIARDNGVSPKDMIFVGDGENDVDAFKLTGRGIAVYPYDEKLGKVAWKTVKSLSEIKDILK